PLLALSVIDVPVAKLALPVVPTLTRSPAGLEEIDSPPRPVAVSVNSTVVAGGGAAGCGLTVKVAEPVAPPPVPVIVTPVELAAAKVVTVKVAVVAPTPTVTLPGTTVATNVFELERFTRSPPTGAALVSVTVPLADAPPVTVAGLSVIELTLAGDGVGGTGLTVNTAERETPAKVPEIDSAVEAVTDFVVIVKVRRRAP